MCAQTQSNLTGNLQDTRLFLFFACVSLTVVNYTVIQKNVHALHSPSARTCISMSNQPVNQIATNKTTRVHPQVISPIFDHNRVFFSVQPVPQMLPDQYDLQRFQRELVCHFLRVNK